jgi:hypothetical protein
MHSALLASLAARLCFKARGTEPAHAACRLWMKMSPMALASMRRRKTPCSAWTRTAG